nr:GAF domain-containing sensor histidine kinase [Alteromonas ponticola]
MKVLSDITGLRFICIARVTESNWTMCAVLDLVNFNLSPGDELEIHTTFCQQVRRSSKPIVIDNVQEDEIYCDNPIPKMYQFESYFSYPIYDNKGNFFGTLCGLDPSPAKLKNPAVESQIAAFSDLLSRQLMAQESYEKMETALIDAKDAARLREQYIAVLGHDIRTPLSSLSLCVDLLADQLSDEFSLKILTKMSNSVKRMNGLISDVMDFTHGRVGDGIKLHLRTNKNLASRLEHTVSELSGLHPSCRISSNINLSVAVNCDSDRICQLLSNLLINAITHGDSAQPIFVSAYIEEERFIVEVKNHGLEIPDSVRQQLFQPFWRSQHNKESKGLGLGLFIASEIAKAHHGELLVKSENDVTTFSFSMQLA